VILQVLVVIVICFFLSEVALAEKRIEKDLDEDGIVNVWTAFENQFSVKQKQDENEDGIMDRVLIFDSEGRLKTLFKDPYTQGKSKTIRLLKI